MPKIKYQDFNFRDATLAMIKKANEIIADYTAQGFDLTLRQVYYQFVARDIISNTERSYKNLASVINDARLAGMIDWNAITDRTRNLRELAHWSDPSQMIDACASQFRFNKWDDQPNYCEVWIEKDALVGVIEGVCNELDVPHFSCRGYTSQSEMWVAAQRLRRQCAAKKTCTLFHLGDHDPSGMDMTRDIQDRLTMFGARVEVKRLALNMEQIEQYDPPPNPAKLSDARAQGYIDEYGDESWELDALEPNVIVELVREAILEVRDEDLWTGRSTEEEEARSTLSAISERFDEVAEFVNE
jgi:hypothetical protein